MMVSGFGFGARSYAGGWLSRDLLRVEMLWRSNIVGRGSWYDSVNMVNCDGRWTLGYHFCFCYWAV